MSKQILRFNQTTGTVVLDKAAKQAEVDVTIDMNSVDTGVEVFNGHIKGADFLDTAQFPTATFKSTKVVFEGDKPVSIEGNLTIKGITKPVTLKVTSFFNGEHPMLKKKRLAPTLKPSSSAANSTPENSLLPSAMKSPSTSRWKPSSSKTRRCCGATRLRRCCNATVTRNPYHVDILACLATLRPFPCISVPRPSS
ncbi:YceI family protein [Neopusillimonas aromaticivorans]|uniref:YceI family protein n=1 Tax=Neopusillimonas aromaticivorans TaxID=2979868 RepID=UPI003D9DCE8A